jgi:hypothetical protein
MAWSWVRVKTGTSPKLRDCMGGDTSARRFEACVKEIVESGDRARLDDVKFELNGRWARVRFEWDDAEVRNAVIYDLEAEEVQDLISGDDLDRLRGGG